MTQFTIDANFPGGNILVEGQQGNNIFLRQDMRDTTGDWFYWAFAVSGAAHQKLTFHFTGGDVLGVRGPAVSYDDGASWEWLEDAAVTRNADNVSFSHAFSERHPKVLFAFCPLYTEANLTRFLHRWNDHAALRQEILCQSPAGRDVEFLRLGNPAARSRILLTCRHHACEAMASYCLEGILEAVLAQDEKAAWLRENVEFAVAPFIDKDGVEAGDQGKNRKPHDHNRDYKGDSIYPEVKALRGWASQWLSDAQTAMLLDLHCPWIRGGGNEEIFFVGSPGDALWRTLEQFSSILEATRKGTLPFHRSNNLPFGSGWNTEQGYAAGLSCSKWAAALPGINFSATLEVAYANAGKEPVTPVSARALGHDIAKALRIYLQEA